MSALREWLSRTPHRLVPLFDTDGQNVRTHLVGASQRRMVRRHSEMEATVVELVESGLAQAGFQGLLYIMGWGATVQRFMPLYVGKAARAGKKHALSQNMVNLRGDKRKFARWGDGNAYHIGDLSQVLFGWPAYKEPDEKYRRWAQMLFLDASKAEVPKLREEVYLALVPWLVSSTTPSDKRATVEEAEEELIDLALGEFEAVVLNVVGETWFAPAASSTVRLPGAYRPRLPIRVISEPTSLQAFAETLGVEHAIGLDVETEMWTQRLCTVQVATRSEVVVIDALALEDLSALASVLAAERPAKVIHNAPFERRILGERGLHLRGVVDTLARSRALRGPRPSGGHGLAAVCKRELGILLDKGLQTSDWTRRPLAQAQKEYAAVDAEVVLELHRTMGRDEKKLL